MTRFLPFLLAIGWALLMLGLSVRRTGRVLAQHSARLEEPRILAELAPLARALEQPHLSIRVFDRPEVNALAAPDGQIYLTRGMVDAWARGAITGPEIASVVAHELGHLSLGHLRRRMIDFTGQNAVFIALTAVLSRFLPFLGIWIAEAVTAAVMARLSRRDEFEADEFAAALLIKSGIGTGPQCALLAKMGDLGGDPGGEPRWLLSHPAIPDRIAAIRAAEASWMHP